MLEISQRLGHNLQRIRKERNLRQIDLAMEINSTEDTIANYENGRRWPSAETIEAMAAALEVDFEEFFKRFSLKGKG